MLSEENLCEHAEGAEIGSVTEAMIQKLIDASKSVDDFKTPQILVLTQDTLMVTALYK
jgi:hypothetical protein